MATAEDRVTILLTMLDDQLAEALIGDLPAERRKRVQERLARLDASPPSPEEVETVLEEFETYLRNAFDQLDGQTRNRDTSGQARDSNATRVTAAATRTTTEQRPANQNDQEPFAPSENPLDDLHRVDPIRLAAALREESPVVVGLIVNCLSSDRASDILQRLPADLRNVTFLRLKQKPHATRRMLEQIARATIEKACSFDELELAAENEDYDNKIAQILRAMDRKQRNEMLQSLEEKDPESVTRMREMMYSIADIEMLHDRTIQRMLAELDTLTLTRVLKNASDSIQQRIFSNLSRRAREGLIEELGLTGLVSDDDRAAAEKKVIQIMVELDQRGELATAE